ncbi:glycosyltransferase family 4 protein [Enterococcus dongliensis]|uniref:glycosyltransferase family 4 protein n=1 Tax=Enterococcus dongliensis TaxID=2559925 RepID=UPI00288D9A8C|nr:glycosyltransferase family 4 protein [Enterococcus dongliensis]MDT2712395.1 glycosyltransferase family 4 protein [Enterococcus dongliensis]
MNVLVAVDAQLFKTPDGKVWTKTIYGYDFWKRYLDVFDTIAVVSRIKNVDYSEVDGFLRSDGERVSFKAMPMARGSKEYIMKMLAFIKAAREAVEGEECAIIRLPSIAATFVEMVFRTKNKPYLLEIVVDPINAFEGNKLAAKLLTAHLKNACRKANGVSYVTQHALQEQYPSTAKLRGKNSKRYFETYYSSIILNKDFFSAPKTFDPTSGKLKIVHTANNINNYVKGHDVVIKVVNKLQSIGIDAEVCFIGDGDKREEFMELANRLGIANKVTFTGLLASSTEVREKLLSSDLFLFPTKCEGLPRAVIEAMAVGLPCLSTPVNGIPELLEKEYMFDPLDVEGFTNMIIKLFNNPEQMKRMSVRNIEKAKEYESTVLQKRRMSFYGKLRKLVEEKNKS